MKGNYDGHDLTQTQAAATKFCSSYLRQMGLLPKILKRQSHQLPKKICVMSNPDFSLRFLKYVKPEARLIEKIFKKVCHFARLSRILFCSKLDPKMAQADEIWGFIHQKNLTNRRKNLKAVKHWNSIHFK